MRLWRFVSSLALVIAMVLAVTHVTASLSRSFISVPCTVGALSAPFVGSMHPTTIDNFACRGDWAFAWATTGAGDHRFGVTEVLRYDVGRQQWRFADRGVVCKPAILPSLVYRKGCFSN